MLKSALDDVACFLKALLRALFLESGSKGLRFQESSNSMERPAFSTMACSSRLSRDRNAWIGSNSYSTSQDGTRCASSIDSMSKAFSLVSIWWLLETRGRLLHSHAAAEKP